VAVVLTYAAIGVVISRFMVTWREGSGAICTATVSYFFCQRRDRRHSVLENDYGFYANSTGKAKVTIKHMSSSPPPK
jgi:hypothetical protein